MANYASGQRIRAPDGVAPPSTGDTGEVLAQEFMGTLTAAEGLEVKRFDQTSAPFVIRAQVLTLDPGVLSAQLGRPGPAEALLRRLTHGPAAAS